jgi:hypothetical protein
MVITLSRRTEYIIPRARKNAAGTACEALRQAMQVELVWSQYYHVTMAPQRYHVSDGHEVVAQLLIFKIRSAYTVQATACSFSKS